MGRDGLRQPTRSACSNNQPRRRSREIKRSLNGVHGTVEMTVIYEPAPIESVQVVVLPRNVFTGEGAEEKNRCYGLCHQQHGPVFCILRPQICVCVTSPWNSALADGCDSDIGDSRATQGGLCLSLDLLSPHTFHRRAQIMPFVI